MRTDTPSSLAASAVRMRGRGSGSGAEPPWRPGGPKCPQQPAQFSRRGERADRAPAESAAVRAQATASESNDRSRRTGSSPRTRPASGSSKAGRIRTTDAASAPSGAADGPGLRMRWPVGPGTSAGVVPPGYLRAAGGDKPARCLTRSPAHDARQSARTGAAPGNNPFPRPTVRPVISGASGGRTGTAAIGAGSRGSRTRSGSRPGLGPLRPRHAGPARTPRRPDPHRGLAPRRRRPRLRFHRPARGLRSVEPPRSRPRPATPAAQR